MARFTAIYDACVLYPAPLRDLLMQLALSDLYRAKWTERIHEEWMSNLLSNPAIKAHADVIVTYNLNDFPESILKPLGLEAQHPDEFISHLIDLAPAAVIGAAKALLNTINHDHLFGIEASVHGGCRR